MCGLLPPLLHFSFLLVGASSFPSIPFFSFPAIATLDSRCVPLAPAETCSSNTPFLPSSRMVAPSEYSDNTLASFAMDLLVLMFSLANVCWSTSQFIAFRREASKNGKAKAKATDYPMLLRLMQVLSNASACSLGAFALAQLLFVSDATKQNAFEPPSSMNTLTAAEKFCAGASKAGTGFYGLCKIFSYLFFFIKQRIVKPMSKPSRLEKFVFFLTCNIVVFITICMVLTQGDSNALDHTCQSFLPIYLLIIMALADASLSLLYLYLFIQPLRETIRQNQATKRGNSAAAAASGAGKDAAAPLAVNLALEDAMRKNTWACVVTVSASFTSMMFLLFSHVSNEPHMRKWVMTVAHGDVLTSGLALGFIMYKGKNADKPRGGPQVADQMLSDTATTRGMKSVTSAAAASGGVAPNRASGKVAPGPVPLLVQSRASAPVSPAASSAVAPSSPPPPLATAPGTVDGAYATEAISSPSAVAAASPALAPSSSSSPAAENEVQTLSQDALV